MTEKAYGAASVNLSDFRQVNLLGEGAYSAVYKVVRLADNDVYALKKVKLPSLSDKEKQNALNEVRLLASIKDRNIVAYKEAFFDEKTACLCIVQEYADGGDLFQLITKCTKEKTYVREADIWRYLQGMCQGLKALHDMRILHRDLKCANVFLHGSREGMIAKLGDFNVSKVAKRGLCITQTGTPYYASPEVWRDMPYDAKSDMWSLGCVLYEVMALKPPFRAEDMEGLYKKVLKGQYPRLPNCFSHDLADVVGTLLQVNPRHRPSVDQLMQMPVYRRHLPEAVQTAALLEFEKDNISSLLNTIKLPKNAIELSGCLPKPRYDLPKVLPSDGGLASDYSAIRTPGEPVPDSLQAYWQQQQDRLPPPVQGQHAARLPGAAPPAALMAPPQPHHPPPPPQTSRAGVAPPASDYASDVANYAGSGIGGHHQYRGAREYKEARGEYRRRDNSNAPSAQGGHGGGHSSHHGHQNHHGYSRSQQHASGAQVPSGGLRLPRIMMGR